MALILKTLQKEDKYYLKKGNTSRAVSMTVTQDGGVLVLNQDQDANVYLTLKNGTQRVVPARLVDVFGTIEFNMDHRLYEAVRIGDVRGRVELGGVKVEGYFTLVIKESGVSI